MNVEHPAALWLLLLIPALLWQLKRIKACQGFSYSHLPLLEDLPVSQRQKWRWLPGALSVLALSAIIIGIAQPYRLVDETTEQQEGIAIAAVLDVSSSMAIRMNINGERKSRLSVAKQVLNEFILGNGDTLEGRSSDLISLVTFARFPRIVSPLTNAHKSLAFMAQDIDWQTNPEIDGTAFGDAIATAAAQLEQYEEQYKIAEKVASKVVILLTDGENNAGDYDPMLAAAMAKKWGVRVYTIFVGEKPGNQSIGSGSGMKNVDWVLQAIADQTGGVYQRAHDYKSLAQVYEAIDELETSRLTTLSFQHQLPVFSWFIYFAIACLLVAALLNATWLRRLE